MYGRVQGQLGLWCELLSNQSYTMRTIRKRGRREELGARQKGREGNVKGEVEKEERERAGEQKVSCLTCGSRVQNNQDNCGWSRHGKGKIHSSLSAELCTVNSKCYENSRESFGRNSLESS